MFHRRRDASKVALVALVERLRASQGPVLLDTQWRTEHLATLGVIDVRRREFQRRLREVIGAPPALS
jgi:leucyl/phenylalanyl-tRNA--protein transferase